MGLFQNVVLDKYISELESHKSVELNRLYDTYAAYFLNPQIQGNIRNCNEEQFQEGFLRELFVNFLGYTLNPDVDYNLTTEKKNIGNAKKSDGAILISGEVVAVIELKDHKTTDLRSIEGQAFGYKNNQRNCTYVIISNFEKLRLYIDNAVEVEEFSLFTLSRAEFAKLYLLLSYTSIDKGLPKQIKKESVNIEEQITKDLYRDYSAFKRALFDDLCERNSQYDSLTLFKKSQKLLDRLLFIFFAEDKYLLPANSIVKIIAQWEQLKELDAYAPLYDRYKKYFNYLNTGHKGKKEEIFAYNGGLFSSDDVLDSVIIDDEILKRHTTKLSEYNFASEVDVNILGHIFENSLTQIEEITTEITTGEKPLSKRKKDGVFYTPRYITTYIVDNTLGKLCREKRAEMGIIEEEYFADKKRQAATTKRLNDNLTQYREWLLSLTICDPACGSGAFLNAALDYLMAEHRLIDEMTAKLMGSTLIFLDIETVILERNLYGIDINDESIEIAKLALWLRTAQPHRKLTSLNNNIKCGNSLISDVTVAADKAFDWAAEFPQVFKNGGFNVVIGNPPYGAKLSKQDIDYCIKQYGEWGISASLCDTYFIFYVMSLRDLLSINGILGFITPNTWKLIESAKPYRKSLFSNGISILQIVQHFNKVFEDATVDCDTLIAQKKDVDTDVLIRFMNEANITNEHFLSAQILNSRDYINLFLTRKDYMLIDKIKSQSQLVKDVLIIKNGVKPYEKGKGRPAQTNETMKTKPFTSDYRVDESFLPLIGGSLFNRYKLLWSNDSWIKYGEWLAAPRERDIFSCPEKLIFRQTSDSIIGTFIIDGFIMRNNTHIILPKTKFSLNLKYVLALLNSALTNYYYWGLNPEKGEAMAEVKAFHLGLLPLKIVSNSEQQPFIECTDKMLKLNRQLIEKRAAFITLLSNNIEGIKITRALECFDALDFKGLLAELKKQKILTPLATQSEWQQAFDQHCTACKTISAEIATTDRTIDQMVYALYNLTPSEIAIIEKQ